MDTNTDPGFSRETYTLTTYDRVDPGQVMDGSGERTPASPPGAAATAEGTKTKAAARGRFDFGDNQVSDALLAGLAEVGATAPRFADRKELTSTDARVDQSRLQMSSKSPIAGVFTGAEMAGARAADGLAVPAFDRRGRRYVLKCKFSNGKNYRFMGAGWTEFMKDHGLLIAAKAWMDRRVTVELWPFRSRALLPTEPDGGDKEGSGHPDGVLGLVVLHRVDGEGGERRAPEAAAADEEAEVEDAGEEEQAAVAGAAAVQEEAPADDANAELGRQGEAAAGAEALGAKVQRAAPMEHGKAGVRNYNQLLLETIAGVVLFELRTSKRKRNDD
ncbi:hypothetical protein ACP4OV_024630 [Aristida adscensionis]